MWPFKRATPRLATRLKIQPPKPHKERTPLAIVLIAKNEAARFRDWLAFHAVAGVTHVILYDNGSTDGTVQIAKGFSSVETTVVPWKLSASEAKSGMRLHQQVLAYAHAIQTFGSNFARMAFIDADEYLVPRAADTLLEALTDLQHPNISLPWAMYGHSGHQNSPKDALPFAFQERAPTSAGPLLNFKCIVDPCDVTMVNPHRFETARERDRTSNTSGLITTNRARQGAFVSHDVIQLNHYYLMSKQEMDAKISGSAISGAEKNQRREAILRKARLIEENPVQDAAAAAFLARHGIFDSDDLRSRF